MLPLFQTEKTTEGKRPLADVIRPKNIEEIVGQSHILGDQGSLQKLIEKNHIPSLILWGPPGCGKTTLAKILAEKSFYQFVTISAVTSGVPELKKILNIASEQFKLGQKTLLLVDEIHRFNRAQQDIFLPYVEDGTIILVGATTENPSFELNSALLSRCKVLVLTRLQQNDLQELIKRAEAYYQNQLPITDNAKNILCTLADGDGRYLLNMCEEIFSLGLKKPIDIEELLAITQKRLPIYDKHQDSHYNLISALHKSLRGSDVDASLYWLGRMLDGGEEPLYIIRRLVRFAVEDIGLADPQAIHQALAAKDAYDFLGSPEGELAIAQAVVYLATSPKSNAVYKASKASMKDAKSSGSLMPPKHILNAPTGLMRAEGYGVGYNYDHDTEHGFSGQNYFPDGMARKSYYQPLERGFERELQKRLEYWQKLRVRVKNGDV